MKLAEYSLQDEQVAQELLDTPDFIEAFSGAMGLLGPCFLYHPFWGETQSHPSINALRSLNIAEEWPFGTDEERALAGDLLQKGKEESDEELERRFGEFFRGPGKLPAAPWGSVYMDHEQVTYGETWVELRAWMRAHGITALYNEKEPEDQFGRMLLLAGQIAKERPELLCEYLGCHVLTWAHRYLDLFEPAASASPTYHALVVLARGTLTEVKDLLGIVPAQNRLYR